MTWSPDGKGARVARASEPDAGDDPPNREIAARDLLPRAIQAGFEGSACLGAWSHDRPEDRLTLSEPLAGLLGLAPQALEFGLGQFLSGILVDDRPRIESTLFAATESGGWFEAEFRTSRKLDGVRWLRLMGRCKRDAAAGTARIEGLAFDVTEGRLPPGTPAQRAQRQVNRLADHVIAMQGIVACLSNPPLSKAVHDVAVEVGFELARRLNATQTKPQH